MSYLRLALVLVGVFVGGAVLGGLLAGVADAFLGGVIAGTPLGAHHPDTVLAWSGIGWALAGGGAWKAGVV